MPNWISRGFRVPVSWPKRLPAATQDKLATVFGHVVVFKELNCVWLKALIISARNWIRAASVGYQFFETVISHWWTPGRRNGARSLLP